MNRRNLIKILGVSAVGLATTPLWIDSWTEEDIPKTNSLGMTEDDLLLLEGLIDTIIPKTDIPGAQELGVNKFVLTMVGDCYEKQVQDEFLAGFTQVQKCSEENYKRSFLELPEFDRVLILESMSQTPKLEEEKINFVNFLKGLTITGFLTSEYVQMNHLYYEMVPSRFNGSMPVSESIYNNV